MMNKTEPAVSIIMGSTSDWETMKNASDILNDFGVAHECKVVSAHRTPDLLFEFAKTAEVRGIEVIIAGAGGAAGAINAALLAISILAISRPDLKQKLNKFRKNQTQSVLDSELKQLN